MEADEEDMRPPGSNFGRHALPFYRSKVFVHAMSEGTKLRIAIEQGRIRLPRRKAEPQDKYSERLSRFLCPAYGMDYIEMVRIVDKWCWSHLNSKRSWSKEPDGEPVERKILVEDELS
jgi:hypothetical protein